MKTLAIYLMCGPDAPELAEAAVDEPRIAACRDADYPSGDPNGDPVAFPLA